MLNKFLEIRDNISINNRITALIISISLSLVIVVVLLLFTISSTNEKVLNKYKSSTDALVKISEFVENIYSVIIKSHIISENTMSEDQIDYTLQIDLLDIYFNNFRRHLDASQKDIFEELLTEADNYVSIIKNINSLELQGEYEKANTIRITKEIKSFNKLHAIVQRLQESNSAKIERAHAEVKKLERTAFRKIYISGDILLILVILMFVFAFSGLKIKLRALREYILVLSGGNVPKEPLPIYDNELGAVSSGLNIVSTKLAAFTKFILALNKGEYNHTLKYKQDINLGILGHAMLTLSETLEKREHEIKLRQAEEEEQNWINTGHTLFGEILRQRSNGIQHLTDDIVKNVVRYLKANQGGLFIINYDEVELISTFAYDRKKFIERKIKLGDGLVGTVALERNTIFLDEIPEGYIEIESGLGDAAPTNLLIVPLKYEDEILGVLEIASFKTIKSYEIKFVEELAHSIASTLLTVKMNTRTEQLLEESQKQSNELALREIEARQNLEKISAAQELAKKREADLTGILSAVDNTLMKGEYAVDGTLMMVNDRHLQTMGYQLHEIQGRNIEMFIPDNELEEFRKIWSSVSAGTPRQIEVERRTKTGDVLWLVNQYTPVTDADGKINKILYLAHDITRFKIGENATVNTNQDSAGRLEAEQLENEILQRKNDLKKIEEEISKLKQSNKEDIENYTDNEIDKLYSEWLNDIK